MARRANPPPDPSNWTYVVFYCLGIGTLLPWNFFITVSDYWEYKWRSVDLDPVEPPPLDMKPETANTNETGLNELQIMWGSTLASASMVPSVTLLLLNAVFGHRFRTIPRLVISLVCILFLFGFTAIMAVVNTDSWQQSFMYLTIACVVFINLSVAIFQGGLIGLAGCFPPNYIGGVFSGQALGGLFASLTNVLVKILGADAKLSAFICFMVAVIFLSLALAAFIVVRRTPFFSYYVGQASHVEPEADVKDNDESMPEQLPRRSEPLNPHISPIRVLAKIKIYAGSIFLTFCVTLSCFPALTSLIVSVDRGKNPWTDVYFVPVVCFVFFNVGDFLGRLAAQHLCWPTPGKAGSVMVLLICVGRVCFIMLFLTCNANPLNRQLSSILIHSDAAYMVLMLTFAFSNGYLANNCMMSAPQLCDVPEQQIAASVMVACLAIGLGAGALLSNLVLKAL